MMDKNQSKKIINAYEIIGEKYVSRALDSVYNDFYERPTMHNLLGSVKNKRILDAGCGSGYYADWLVQQNATVFAIDASPKMVELTQKRLGKLVNVQQADLNDSLGFFDLETFDIILCSLVLDYIHDWERLFTDFNRILVDSGRLLFSVHHPFFLDLKVNSTFQDTYFSTQLVEENWLPFGLTIPSYRRPLGEMSSVLKKTGFVIEQIIEPQPIEACKDEYPKVYEQLRKHPVILCMSARKVV